jgi:transketolase
VDHFGASAPGPVVMAHYGFTVEHVVSTAKAVLANNRMPGHGSRD